MRLRNGLMLGSLAATLALFPAVGRSAEPDTATVLRDLHAANQMEIAAGELARSWAQTVHVQTFGATLVSDHRRADEQVVALANEEKIDLSEVPPMPADEMRALKSAKVPAFDELFALKMLEGHDKIVAEAKAARDQTSDAKLRELLDVMIPVLEGHQQTARSLVNNFGPNAAAAAAAKKK